MPMTDSPADSPADHLGAVARRLDSVVREGRELPRLTVVRTYPADIDDVWDALTNGDRIPRWFLPVSGELRPGGRFQLEGNAGGEVLTCDPPRHLAVTWEYGEELSWVDVVLTTGDDGTRLELVHVAPVDAEKWAEYGPGAVGVGWELGLMGLARHLTDGATVDPVEATAWMSSPAGIEFMTGSSHAWGGASIAAGEDPDRARAAAARSTTAYTTAREA